MANKTKKLNIDESQVSNDAMDSIDMEKPYIAKVTITGSSKILFHRWSTPVVDVSNKARKNSDLKKYDNLESYIHRDDDGHIAIPGEYLRQSIIQAAKFRQDPRSPRKSAMDLFKAAVVSLTDLASCGQTEWDFTDRRRVTIQRAGITRERPGLYEGWKATFDLQILTPEYIGQTLLADVITDAGRLVGIGDFRPTFGRFYITCFDVGE